MHDITTSDHIFDQIKQLLQDFEFDLGKLVGLSTDGAANMASKHNGVSANYEKR